MIKWLKKLFSKKQENKLNYIEVNNLDELYNTYKIMEMSVGKLFYVKDTKEFYMLKSLNYTNNEDIKKCFVLFKNKKLKSSYGNRFGIRLNMINLTDKYGNRIDPENTPNLDIFIAEGYNFEDRGIHNNDYICVDKVETIKENNIVMDMYSHLWTVEKIEKDEIERNMYSLIRKDGRKVYVTEEDIYGVVVYAWTLH